MRSDEAIERLNQHKLVNDAVVEQLVEQAKRFGPPYLEIGAGDGVITRKLSESGLTHAIEIDPRFSDELRSIPRVKLICGNALKVRLPFFRTAVGNIPFSITEALLHRLIRKKWHEGIVLIIGNETAQHHIDLVKRGQATRISLLLRVFWDCEELKQIDCSCFDPPPSRDPYLFTGAHRSRARGIAEVIFRRILTSDQEHINVTITNGYLMRTRSHSLPDRVKTLVSSLRPVACRRLTNEQLTRIWQTLSSM